MPFPAEISNTLHFAMDYRDFLFDNKPTFNANVAQIWSMLTLDSYYIFEKAIIQNDIYKCKDSDVFNLYGQFGINNASYVPVFEEDSYDTCGLFLGNHKIYNGGKKSQIFFITIQSYYDMNSWTSNLDFGADSTSYEDVIGPSAEWINKDHHKGFDVTVNRCFPHIVDYINELKDDSFETYLYCFGQSRVAALANLLGKKFKDNYSNLKSVFYCFNSPRTVQSDNQEMLSSYDNIFYLLCDEDIVSELPLKNWGFGFYGIHYSFSHVENEEYYNSISPQPLVYYSDEVQTYLINFVNSISKTREGVFEFREPDYKNNLELFDNLSYLEALLKQQQLENFSDNKISLKSVENDLLYGSPNNYSIQLYTRPSILIGFLNSIFKEIPTLGELPLNNILKILLDYEPVMPRYTAGLLQLISYMNDHNAGIYEIYSTHSPFATVISSKFAKPVIE